MAGSRYSAVVNQVTDLQFTFTINGVPTEPDSFNQVKIFSSYDDAYNNTNEIETILAGNISSNGSGTASYQMASVATAGVYYDRIWITPKPGYSEWSDPSYAINIVNVRDEDFGGIPGGELSKCLIKGYVIDAGGNLLNGVRIKAEPVEFRNISQFSIPRIIVETVTNEVGFWSLYLVRSLVNVRVKYKFTFSYEDSSGNTYKEEVTRVIPDEDEQVFPLLVGTTDYR